MSEVPENGERPSQNDEDEIPRQGILASIPKRSLYRVVLWLAALAGILYLRQRTASIASCMSDTFRLLPAPEQRATPASIKARVVLPADRSKER